MDEFVDYYDLLGVEPDATVKDIEKAYRKKAQKCHPDKNPDDPNAAALFVEINRVKNLLSNPDERAIFDRARKARLAKEEKFKAMDAQNQRLRTDLESREREAEARAKSVAHKHTARTVATLRAASIALTEKINAELESAKRAGAASAPAAAGKAASEVTVTGSIEPLDVREARLFAAVKAAATKRRRIAAVSGPSGGAGLSFGGDDL